MELKDRPILLVDDELDILSQLKIILNQEGFEVISSTNGVRGLAEFKKHRPAICIIDFKMPGMDGLELLHEIKKIDSKSEVILISGHADMKIAVQAIKDHAFDFLSKPIDIDELVRKVNDVIVTIEEKKKYEEKWTGGILSHKIVDYGKPLSEITLQMDLDEFGGPLFAQEIFKLEESGILKTHVIFSLGKVKRINNVGLNILLDVYNKTVENGKKVGLVNLTLPVFTYLQTLGYDKYFFLLKVNNLSVKDFSQL